MLPMHSAYIASFDHSRCPVGLLTDIASPSPPARNGTARAAPGSGVWIPLQSCNQLGLSVTTLGVFLRKHFITDVCSDAQTKGLIGPGWNDLV